jgi:CDP-diacylglycerol--glycerol-3-phosphate 3-phosphatidyltransferase
LPFAILTTTFMISYQRSKAESLGLVAKGGLMERAERMILLGVGLLANAIFIPVLWIMLA